MQNRSNIKDFFKWGGRWDSLQSVHLMTRAVYTLVRVVYLYEGNRQEFIDKIPAFDMNTLDDDFRNHIGSRQVEIEKVIILERSNCIHDLGGDYESI